jgi:hypothetical protein
VTASDDANSVDGLFLRRAAVLGAQHGDSEPGGRQTLRDTLHVPFRSAALGVADITPVDEENVDLRGSL